MAKNVKVGYQTVPLMDLVIYAENPRHEPANNEYEAMKLLWCEASTPKKMMNLAIDIAENGLSPIEIPVVVPCEGKKYEVYDGNRRLTALHVLTDPDRYDFISKSHKAKLKEVVEQSSISLPEAVVVYITDETDALNLIKKIHIGEDDGRGRTKWDAGMIRRFELRNGGIKDEVDILLDKSKEYFNRTDLTAILDLTSIKRMFFAPIKKALQIDKKNINSFTKDRVELAIKLIECAAIENNNGNRVSRWRVKNAEEYLLPIIDEEIAKNPLSPISEPPEIIPESTDNELGKPEQNSGIRNEAPTTSNNDPGTVAKPKQKKKNPKSKPAQSPYFLTGLQLNGLDPNIQSHHGLIELGNELIEFSAEKDVERYPLAAAFLLRSFIESTLAEFLKNSKDRNGKNCWEALSKKNGRHPELSVIRKYVGNNMDALFPPQDKRLYEEAFERISKIIEPVNLGTHQPNNYQVTVSQLLDFPKEGVLAFLNYMITKISGQNDC